MGSLSNLTILGLWGNELTGTIPAELGSLANLVQLQLADNQLTGEIPSELGSLSNLTILGLWGNELTGTIPAELGSLANLVQLQLADNQLTGEIPSELGSLSNLTILGLWGNELTGTIPAELGNLVKLEQLYLWGNELTGAIPSGLGSLTNLTVLNLGRNQLTGEIPPELGSLTNLTVLDLGDNDLTGTMPTQLGDLINLEELHLTQNQLAGKIPTELARLTSLKILAVGGNQLTGEIPPELGNLVKLEQLYLWGNELTGEVPSWLGVLSNLEVLFLSDNQLTGPIPVRLGSLSDLEVLYLGDNQLAGEIPPELGNLVKLERLSLSDNQLTGMLPDSLTRMTALTRFFFYNNPGLCAPVGDTFQEWIESIADGIGSSCAPVDSPEDRSVLVKLHEATGGAGWVNSATWLSDRPIREWYGVVNDASGHVTGLFLHRNQLTGEIPAELGNLTNLARLRLDGNRLTGTIPAELGRLTNLTVLYLSGNPLTGCVPASLRDVEDTDFAQLGLTFCTSGIDVGIAEDLSIAGDAAVSDYAEDQADTTVATYTVSGDNVATAMWSLPTGDPDGDGPLVAAQTRDKDFFKLEGAGQERVLKFKAAPNFEMPRGQAVSATNTNVYMVTLQVRHDDEDIAFRPVTITVTDVDELDELTPDMDSPISHPENSMDTVATYTVTGTMADMATWTLEGDDAESFMLEGTGMSRMLKFSSAPNYEAPADADSDNTYMVTVKARPAAKWRWWMSPSWSPTWTNSMS